MRREIYSCNKRERAKLTRIGRRVEENRKDGGADGNLGGWGSKVNEAETYSTSKRRERSLKLIIVLTQYSSFKINVDWDALSQQRSKLESVRVANNEVYMTDAHELTWRTATH